MIIKHFVHNLNDIHLVKKDLKRLDVSNFTLGIIKLKKL